MRNLVALAAVAAAFVASPAMASVGVVVPGVYSTGVGTDGAVLSVGSTDPHYTIGGTGATVYAGPATPGTGSAYIGSSDPSSPNGWYYFTTTFDLTGYNAVTAVLTGNIAADDSANIYLNGNLIGQVSGFQTLQPFSTNTGFVAGVNTLEIQDYNVNGPYGIDISDLRVTAAPEAGGVPEPATWAMMLLGFGGIGLAMRRKSTAAVATA